MFPLAMTSRFPLLWMLPSTVVLPDAVMSIPFDMLEQLLLSANMKSQPLVLPGFVQTLEVLVQLAPAPALWLVEVIPATFEKTPPEVADALTVTVLSVMVTLLAVIVSPFAAA